MPKAQTTQIDKKALNEIKESLVERKNSIMVKLNSWEDKSSPSGMKEMGDLADIASEINEESLSSALTENEIELLRQIEIALEKMENGTYGICEGTGKKIPIARLKAIPWTPYTVEFAEIAAKNKQKMQFSSRGDKQSYNLSSMDSDSMD